MARRGKAIFDASMMAGWGLVACVTVLLVLTMVSDPEKSLNGSTGDRSSLARNRVPTDVDRSVVTSSIDKQEPPTAAIRPETRASAKFSKRVENNLLKRQNASFDPFKNGSDQQKLLNKLSQQLAELQRRVNNFQNSSRSLRDENRRLRNRVADLEKMEGRLKKVIASNRPVRIVPLPGRDGKPTITAEQLAAVAQSVGVDPQPTGSIRPSQPNEANGQKFDPFSVEKRDGMTLKRQPLDFDLDAKGKKASMSDSGAEPRPKPRLALTTSQAEKAMAPVSKVVQTPQQVRAPSRTSFALNLGEFVSLPELRSAWQEISGSQNQIVGDLKPATSILQAANNRIHLNLLLGPIQNAAEAATLCVRLKDRGYDCSVAPFQGQALVFNR